MTEFPPEASWATAMRKHFAEHGFYRQEDLNRLLGEPGQSVRIGSDGKVAMTRRAALSPDGDGKHE